METEKRCVICGHLLSSHVDEGKWFRCHSVSCDGYQCECRILKEVLQEEPLESMDIDTRLQTNLEMMEFMRIVNNDVEREIKEVDSGLRQ